MIDNSSKFKIVFNGWGNYSVKDCSLENALELYEQVLENIPKTYKNNLEKYKDNSFYFVSTSIIKRMFEEIINAENGSFLEKTTKFMHGKEFTEEQKMFFSAEFQQQFFQWLTSHGFKISDIQKISTISENIEKYNPAECFLMKGLYQRAGTKQIMFIEDYEMETLDEMRILSNGKWKDTAKLSSVVNRYIEFYNNWSHRDDKVHLADYS